MGSTIANACNVPLNQQPAGSVPDVSGALKDWFQPLTFSPVTKTTSSFQVIETGAPVPFFGFFVPFKNPMQQLEIGQRKWSWIRIFAEPTTTLQDDDVVVINGIQTRVMDRFDYTLNGFLEYHVVQDWTGAGP